MLDIPPATAPSIRYESQPMPTIEERANTVPDIFKSNRFHDENKYTHPAQGLKNVIILVDGTPILITEKNIETDTAATQSDSFKEQLASIKSDLSLSITQLAELFGVTRKTIYDWYEGTTPRQGITSRMSILIDALKSMPSDTDLTRLKTVWNIPVSGRSFCSIFNDDVLDELSCRKKTDKKLHELSPRMVKKMDSQHKTRVQLGKAHLAEFDKHTNAT